MRTGEEILQLIDEHIANMLERPEMYAPTPQALEAILSQFDWVRELIVGQSRKRYRQFTGQKGLPCGNSFTGFYQPELETYIGDRETYKPLCDFWREYIAMRDSGLLGPKTSDGC